MFEARRSPPEPDVSDSPPEEEAKETCQHSKEFTCLYCRCSFCHSCLPAHIKANPYAVHVPIPFQSGLLESTPENTLPDITALSGFMDQQRARQIDHKISNEIGRVHKEVEVIVDRLAAFRAGVTTHVDSAVRHIYKEKDNYIEKLKEHRSRQQLPEGFLYFQLKKNLDNFLQIT
jgi:hypothetical protein